MAVTKGHGNPDWSRDEILLALDLYLECEGDVPGPEDSRVISLSEEIRRLPIHSSTSRRETFRNPAGVAFKLQNIRQVATGRGLEHASEADRTVWTDFGNRPELVQKLAREIREQIGHLSFDEVASFADDEEFIEGRILTAVHRTHERSRKTRARLIRARLVEGTLACEACGEGPKTDAPELAHAGFEAHHVIPLASLEGIRTTRVKDLALLCATCHRLIHSAINVYRKWITVDELRSLMFGRKAN